MGMYEDLVGKSAEMAVKTFLEMDGYKVMPYGVEYALRTGISMTREQYVALSLPNQIRRTPDFLAISPKCEYWRLLEVKYRSHWDEQTRTQLKQPLMEQASSWGNVHVAIGLKEPFGGKAAPDSQIRIAQIFMEDKQLCVFCCNNSGAKKWDNVGWGDLGMLKESFPECCGNKYAVSRFRELAYYFANMPQRFDDEILSKEVFGEIWNEMFGKKMKVKGDK